MKWIPDGTNPFIKYTDDFHSDDLRRDGEVVRLIDLYPVVIGQRAYMRIDLGIDDGEYPGSTDLETTPVVSVEVVG